MQNDDSGFLQFLFVITIITTAICTVVGVQNFLARQSSGQCFEQTKDKNCYSELRNK